MVGKKEDAIETNGAVCVWDLDALGAAATGRHGHLGRLGKVAGVVPLGVEKTLQSCLEGGAANNCQ